ncbi:C69 family dipeptidase [Liquorilactobacillus oeni]|uniref:Dipeptidase n=1 Tax=Liquorilactobacillus oeni DSM 19972 TaxID=1423777 RepID=A0A0R1MGB4_9LACO|nr:C69 family dipeptidase [Liquorilactobacillus oeni]KRL04210.1 Dipeptidase [Liquorilactobacillus oeni DSM 19972]
MTDNTKDFSACTSILVGKKATADGSIMIARNEDFKTAWPKHFVVHPHHKSLKQQTFISSDNGFRLELPLISSKYTATPEWTDQYGTFEEDGINEDGVAMSATESAYANERVLGADPLVKNGIGEEAIVTVVLPYIKTAREGVARLGKIVETKGASETNGVLFADNDEAWYMEIATGHCWAAQRIPDDCYAVVANQLALEEIDFADTANFMTATNLKKFVTENRLNSDNFSFNFRKIFGTHELSDEIYSTPRVWYGQKQFTPSIISEPTSESLPFIQKPDNLLHREDLEFLLASHFQRTVYDPLGVGTAEQKHRFRPISLAETQESHILQLRPWLPKEINGLHWLALGVTAQSVFVPFYASLKDTPVEYQKGIETFSFDSAYWRYKLLGILVDPHYLTYGEKLKALQKDLRIKLNHSVHISDRQALKIFKKDKLISYLTKKSHENAALALKEVDKLTAQLITQSTDLSPLNFKTDENL